MDVKNRLNFRPLPLGVLQTRRGLCDYRINL